MICMTHWFVLTSLLSLKHIVLFIIVIVHFTNLEFLCESRMDIWTIETELEEAVVGPCCLPKSVSC